MLLKLMILLHKSIYIRKTMNWLVMDYNIKVTFIFLHYLFKALNTIFREKFHTCTQHFNNIFFV